MLTSLPFLGVGLGYRSEIDGQIWAHRDAIDWLEVITEHFVDRPIEQRERLLELSRSFPLIPHGVELSIGSGGPVNSRYVRGVAQLVSSVRSPWFSDHLCFTRADGIALGSLTPLPRTRAVAAEVARKAAMVQAEVGVPLLLENITYYFDLGGELTENEFLAEVLEQSDCSLLLDLTNVYTNSRNHHFDMFEFVDGIPLERVVQIHLAGGVEGHGALLDSHSTAVPEEVFSLLQHVSERAPNLRGVLIERDRDYPEDFSEILRDLDRARMIVGAAKR